jgi:lipoprotein NlpI
VYAGQLEEAFWIFTKIVDEDPENGFAFLNRGFVLHRRDKIQLAESDLNQVRYIYIKIRYSSRSLT